MKEGAGDNNLAVAWQYPGQALEVIPAEYSQMKMPPFTNQPTNLPSSQPTILPTQSPTNFSTSPPTGQPTNQRTPSPTNLPTSHTTDQSTPPSTGTPPPTPCTQADIKVEVFTDNFPRETSWTLTNNCGTSDVFNSPVYPVQATLYTSTFCLPPAEYTFQINDSYNDGFCCSHGDGLYTVTLDGDKVASGGQFASSQSTTFGNCGGEELTTLSPTSAVSVAI